MTMTIAEPSKKGFHAGKPLPSPDELRKIGKSLREKCPRGEHAIWKVPNHRPDPLRLLEQSNKGRIPGLIPIRYGRMARTPFTFYRGAALNMAADLAATPSTGVHVQACGDAHLLNFGGFATPERRVVFDINDLDETLPAPWEWDVKRLAASFVLACRDNGFGKGDAEDAVMTCVGEYRKRMEEYSEMTVLEVWYASIDVETALASVGDKEARHRAEKRIATARARSVADHDFPKLTTGEGEAAVIKDNAPLIYHYSGKEEREFLERAQEAFAGYRRSLEDERRVLLDRFELRDIAVKVVGVGSVGTFCGVMLMMASEKDPLFLQVKEANASVLEAYAGKSRYRNHGQRVINGQRLMQSASDIFLGWTEGRLGRQFYVRQLRDMKLGAQVELFTPDVMIEYARFCGWALAKAHARSGSPATISGYLGKNDSFDAAIAEFAKAYADQSERDHDVLKKAARSGKVAVVMEADR
jgi:uncharacterized protein (DUF2252 family)